VAATSVDAVRERFSALRAPLAFFDGPGGTQVPDSVIEAIATYLRSSNANLGGAFATSRASDAVAVEARDAAAAFLGASSEEVLFGANMTSLNFSLSHTVARGWRAGDEVVVTKLDHDGNISPWLELAHDLDLSVRFCELDRECRLDLEQLRSLLSERTRVVAFPWASNGVGVVTPVAEVCALAHDAGALAWVDAVHYAPHGPIDVADVDADVLLCSPYKFYGPHLGLAFARRELLAGWRPYKVRPAPEVPAGRRHETGTPQLELLAGFIAAVRYLDEVGWDFVRAHEHVLGCRFLAGLPESWTLHGPHDMESRVPTFALTSATLAPAEAAERLGERGFAVWHGDYYAVEVMRHLGLPEGAVRVGIVHTNTSDEVDRLLAALAELG